MLDLPRVSDVDPVRRAERERQLAARVAAMELEKSDKPKDKDKDKSEAQAEFAKLIGSRSGGVYMPPARLRALQAAAASDKSSPEYQRLSWDALRKSITGIVNRVNIINIKQVVPELFSENLIRGRGLFARSIMKAQAASLPFTPVFAALVSIINTKLPQVGELLLTRLISQFRRSFKRNDKTVCHSTTTFIGHLVNQGVAHELVALQILMLLLEHPTDDSIEIAVGFMREVGAFLTENSPKANTIIFERFRTVLNEGSISHRVQYMIEVLMQVRKDKFKDNPILPDGLDLVEEDDQITHQIQLEDDLQVQEGLNVFKIDPNYLENEEKYKSIKAEILGDEDSEGESGSEESSGDEEEEEEEEDVVEAKEGIEDRTETNLVNLRRTIYLTIMNALNYEEAVHKLMKVQIQEGQEIELVNMVIECCSQERSYSNFYGLVGERFSKLNRVWTDCLEAAFGNYYTTIHRYETNRLRNIARFFGHLFASDAISWMVMECVKINEDDTTSSSRIFVKILMTEMMESMGLKNLAERFKDSEVKRGCQGMFPMDVPKNTRFAINYFTSIGLGILTEDMREYLKNAPRLIMEQRRAMLEAESSSDSDSSSSDSDSDSESSLSSNTRSSSLDSRRRTSRHRDRRHPSSTPPRSRSRRRDDVRGRRRDSGSPPRRGNIGRYYSRSPSRDRPERERERDDLRYRRRSRSSSTPPRIPPSKVEESKRNRERVERGREFLSPRRRSYDGDRKLRTPPRGQSSDYKDRGRRREPTPSPPRFPRRGEYRERERGRDRGRSPSPYLSRRADSRDRGPERGGYHERMRERERGYGQRSPSRERGYDNDRERRR